MWRELCLDGKTAMKEVDCGKEKSRLFWVYRDSMLYEGFRRQGGGSVEPMDSEELAKAKREVEQSSISVH